MFGKSVDPAPVRFVSVPKNPAVIPFAGVHGFWGKILGIFLADRGPAGWGARGFGAPQAKNRRLEETVGVVDGRYRQSLSAMSAVRGQVGYHNRK